MAGTKYLAFHKYSGTAFATQRVTRRGFDASVTRAGVQSRTDEKCVLLHNSTSVCVCVCVCVFIFNVRRST